MKKIFFLNFQCFTNMFWKPENFLKLLYELISFLSVPYLFLWNYHKFFLFSTAHSAHVIASSQSEDKCHFSVKLLNIQIMECSYHLSLLIFYFISNKSVERVCGEARRRHETIRGLIPSSSRIHFIY